MRASVILLLCAGSLTSAPVPKELRTPSIVGTWTITGANVQGAEHADYHGQRWTFGDDGSFANPAHPTGSYAVRPSGMDFHFGRETIPWMAFVEFDGDRLRIAFPKDRDKRAVDFIGANNNVVYTFKSAKE